jgi:hypothetical protein
LSKPEKTLSRGSEDYAEQPLFVKSPYNTQKYAQVIHSSQHHIPGQIEPGATYSTQDPQRTSIWGPTHSALTKGVFFQKPNKPSLLQSKRAAKYSDEVQLYDKVAHDKSREQRRLLGLKATAESRMAY